MEDTILSMRRMMEACATREELDRVVVHWTFGTSPGELSRQAIVDELRRVERTKGWCR